MINEIQGQLIHESVQYDIYIVLSSRVVFTIDENKY
jgi:hypothetical protein